MKGPSIVLGVLFTALLCGRASAAETDYPAGTRALPLQQAGGSARAMAMGSAVVAVSQGSASLLWNPAGLSRMSCTELGLHHNSGLARTNQEIFIFGMPLGGAKEEGKGGALGGIAASFGFVDHGRFEGRDAAGLPTGDYKAGDMSGSVGWGMQLLPQIAGGIVLKGSQSTFAERKYDSYSTDLGVLVSVLPRVDLGLAYSNINIGPTLAGSRLTSGWRLGAAWNVDKHLVLAASGEIQDKAMNRIQLGTEYLVGNVEEKRNVLALRAGYQAHFPNPQLTGLTGLTLGLGYTLSRSIALDYAMVPVGDLGTTHRLSLTFRFNCPKKPEPPVAAAAAPEPARPQPAVVAAPAPEPKPRPILAPVALPPVVLKSILLTDQHFDFDKSTLKPEGMQALRENVRLLKDNPETMVRVAGYTSMMGTREYNQLLSERRAAAVEHFLIMEGDIDPGRISTVGFGESRPATHEPSPDRINSPAAKSNMRVLFEITVR